MENQNQEVKQDFTDVKKAIYKENPNADLMYIRKEVAYYEAKITGKTVLFEVPCNDMGDADYLPVMTAKHLLRYIKTYYQS